MVRFASDEAFRLSPGRSAGKPAQEPASIVAARPLNNRNILTLGSMMLLVGIEVFGVAIAAGWAIAGLFELGDTVGHALMALFSLLAAYIMVQLWRKAVVAEPLRG
jgi:hypothetical protein